VDAVCTLFIARGWRHIVSAIIKADNLFFSGTCSCDTKAVFCRCSRAAEALLIVNILDVNDERPRFLAASYSFHVLENQAAGTLVGVVSARDDDGAPYNQLSLSLLPAGSLSDAFSIDPLNGRLLTTRPLDRERQVS